jgi:hypothetical protein
MSVHKVGTAAMNADFARTLQDAYDQLTTGNKPVKVFGVCIKSNDAYVTYTNVNPDIEDKYKYTCFLQTPDGFQVAIPAWGENVDTVRTRSPEESTTIMRTPSREIVIDIKHNFPHLVESPLRR